MASPMGVPSSSKNFVRIKLFQNSLLERLTYVHPVIPALIWGPIIAYLLHHAVTVDGITYQQLGGMACLGVLFWTFFEYMFHRFVFHFPAKNRVTKRIVYLFHGIHHDQPSDFLRLVMPPAPAALFASMVYIGFRFLIGPVWVGPFFAFFMLGYLWYDYTHLYLHFANPRTRYGKWLKQYHMVHHFADHDAKWGVSNPLWDYIMGTTELPKKKNVQA